MRNKLKARLKTGAAVFVAASTVALLSNQAAYAQATGPDAAKPDAAKETGVNEIIVTAQKRAQNLQDVPVSVTAITSADLDNKQIVTLEDIRSVVPNLYMEQALSGTTTPKMFTRGVGVDNQVFSFDSPIGLYFDDVYIARVTGALVDLFDVERVEFLRGPQGTLFGRNSSAGALRITTKLPTLNDFEGKATLAYGTRNQVNANFAVSAPLIQDKLGLRLTFMSRRNDGFQTDQTGERFMNNDITAFRGSLLYQASDNVDVVLRGDYMSDHSRPTMPYNFRASPNPNPFTFERTLSSPFINEVRPWGVSGTINADLSSFTVKSITAYRHLHYKNAQDVDGKADVSSFEVTKQFLEEWQFSHETFLTSEYIGKIPLKWTAGVFYMHEKNDFTWALRIFSPPTTQFFKQNTDTFAVYGQATYPITDRFNVTGGLRYTYEKKALTARQNLADGTPNTGFLFNDSITAKKVNWHASADYKVADQIMLYANAGTGFRSGGFNGSARDVASILSGSFGPETVFTAEGGAKTQWLDNRIRLNVDYFYSDYKNLQQAITLSDGTISTRNVSATVKGIEAELTAVPVDGLEITGTLGTMAADVKQSNLSLKDTPKLKWRLGFVYTMPLGADGGELRFGGDASYTMGYFNDTNNAPNTFVKAYELFNAQIAYKTPDERWEFKLSGTNLGNHVFSTHTFDIAGGFISSVKFPSTPRRWLFTVGYNF